MAGMLDNFYNRRQRGEITYRQHGESAFRQNYYELHFHHTIDLIYFNLSKSLPPGEN